MEILLHLGGHKTGTTVLQQTLLSNFSDPNSSAIYYPPICCDDWQHRRLFEAAAQNDLETLTSIIVQYAQSARDTSTLILSSEFAQLCDKDAIGLLVAGLKRVFPSAHIRACLYARRQDELFDSLLNQQVKLGRYRGGLQQIITEYGNIGYYARYASGLASHLGEAAVVVRNYGNLVHGDIVADFEAVLGSPIGRAELATENIDLAPPLFELKRRCNKFITIEDWDFQRDFAAILSDVSRDIGRPSTLRYVTTAFERDAVLAIYKDDNAELFDKFVCGDPWGREEEVASKSPGHDRAEIWASLLVHILQYIDFRGGAVRLHGEREP